MDELLTNLYYALVAMSIGYIIMPIIIKIIESDNTKVIIYVICFLFYAGYVAYDFYLIT